MPTGRRRLASSLRAAEPSSPNEAKALSNNPADNTWGRGREQSFIERYSLHAARVTRPGALVPSNSECSRTLAVGVRRTVPVTEATC